MQAQHRVVRRYPVGILATVRHWRRHLGPPDGIIAWLMIFILALLVGGAYLLAIWGISAIWEKQHPGSGHGSGFAGVAVRQTDGTILFHLASRPDALEYLDRNAPPSANTMLVGYFVVDTFARRWWDIWSASQLVSSLEFNTFLSPRAHGGPLTPDEQLQILHTLQRDHPETLSPIFHHAASLSASQTIRTSVYHNMTRGIATLLAFGGLLWGASWIARAERRYRQWFLGICAECGYPLRGIHGDRCPECGTQWWPYGDDAEATSHHE